MLCVCVCLQVMTVSPGKMYVLFVVDTRVGPRNYVFDKCPHGKGQFWGHLLARCDVQGLFNTWQQQCTLSLSVLQQRLSMN